MSNSAMCKCCTCGYEWVKGRDGSHSCRLNLSVTLRETRALLSDMWDINEEFGVGTTSPKTKAVLDKVYKLLNE